VGATSEGFHAPQLFEISPASIQSFPAVTDPSRLRRRAVEERQIGNPNLRTEVALNGPTDSFTARNGSRACISADWCISTCDRLPSILGAQFIIEHNLPGLVQRAPTAIPGELGPIRSSSIQTITLRARSWKSRLRVIYILDTSIFGHGDFGSSPTL